jgi:D-alanyl-D-alanine carboxypeptidase/D-alanyl-D-alanine-endopeptidase (penicillin-binding protein 4)
MIQQNGSRKSKYLLRDSNFSHSNTAKILAYSNLILQRLSKIPIFLLLFFIAQLMPGLAASELRQQPKSHPQINKSPSPSVRLQLAQKSPSSASICPAQLETAIDAVINRPQFQRSRWGILIAPLSPAATNSILYSHDAQRYFIPASNAKLLTTAAALHQLGANFRIRTSIYQTSTNALRVVGRGDPSLTDSQLKDLAQQLQRQGIQNVPQLIVDQGYFQGETINLTWDWEDIQSDYGTSVNSLILNQNAVELTLSPQQIGQPLRVSWADAIASKQWEIENTSLTAKAATPDSVTVSAVFGQPLLRVKGQLAVDAKPEIIGLPVIDPAEYFLQHLREALAVEKINVVKASVATHTETTNERELAKIESPPLATLLVETNQESNNLYAEVLLRTLGISPGVLLSTRNPAFITTPTLSTTETAELGLQQMKETLTNLGVNPQSYVLVDGSGLSRQNLVSPEAITQTLKLIAQTPQAATYRASLSTAGVNGTLARRFVNTTAQGNLQAKTGTLTGVSALSGYLNVPGYQPLVFSIMVNQSHESSTIQRQAIDEIVLLLTRLRFC